MPIHVHIEVPQDSKEHVGNLLYRLRTDFSMDKIKALCIAFNASLKLVIHKYLRVIKAHKKLSPNSTFSAINEPLQLKGEEKEENERKINSK